MDVKDLDGLSALEGVVDTDRERIAAAATRREYRAGDRIMSRGELTDEFFLIVSGTVEISVDGEVVAERSAGEFFGEVGATSAGPGYAMARTATVTAKTDVCTAVIPGWNFSELVATIAQFRSTVYAELDRLAEQ